MARDVPRLTPSRETWHWGKLCLIGREPVDIALLVFLIQLLITPSADHEVVGSDWQWSAVMAVIGSDRQWIRLYS